MAVRKKKNAGRKKGARKKKAARKKSSARRSSPVPTPEPTFPWLTGLTERITELVEHTATGALRRVVDAGGREIGAWLPEATEMRVQGGAYLREMRELAGLTIDELAEAIELTDHSILEAVEAGTATLSFELILRLSAVLARHDPIPFIARFTRTYSPEVWRVLEGWGVGRLPLHFEREREFINIYRRHDAARKLSDEGFARVLDFTRAAFEMSLHFTAEAEHVEDEPVDLSQDDE
jgi:transcriptional regulator with XRE-family HTH domain